MFVIFSYWTSFFSTNRSAISAETGIIEKMIPLTDSVIKIEVVGIVTKV